MKKKVLILPAIEDHIGAVKTAQKMGYKVITCDNVPSNPAHSFADSCYNIDLLDYDEIIHMSKQECIDTIWAYSTDIGALTAAFVSEALNLNYNSLSTVINMTNKAMFRNFLKKNGFNYPNFKIEKPNAEHRNIDLKLPLIIKPIDRASSKGVKIIHYTKDITQAIENAKSYSFNGEVIIEEFIDGIGQQLHGDAIVNNGKLIFFEVGDQFFSGSNDNLAPTGTILPSIHSAKSIKQIKEQVIRFIQKVGYKNGGLNIEARINKEGQIFLIEVAPRSGGNYIPELMSFYCGFEIKDILFNTIINRRVTIPNYKKNDNTIQFIWRAKKSGILKKTHLSNQLNILGSYSRRKIGEDVTHFAGNKNILAIFIILCHSRHQAEDVFINPHKYFKAIIK